MALVLVKQVQYFTFSTLYYGYRICLPCPNSETLVLEKERDKTSLTQAHSHTKTTVVQ